MTERDLMKLYSDAKYPTRWYAHDSATGWWMFPSEPNGWVKRQPARGMDPLRIREVPAHLAAEAAFPAAELLEVA